MASAVHHILVINPGSTSTKIALYENDMPVLAHTIRHDAQANSVNATAWDQFECRLRLVKEWVSANHITPTAVVSIGGLLRPVEGGVYRINERMMEDARAGVQGDHASNLGCVIAHDIAIEYRSPAFVVDPVSVDEFEPLARYSGHPLIERRTLSHALSIHAVVRRVAEERKIPLEHSAFVVAHLGGGISIAPVKSGRIIDTNDASSDGPFSPERTGGLPLQQFISLCYSGKYMDQELRSLVMGRGGLFAYLGTNSAVEVEKRIEGGDQKAKEVYEAMAYQIAKEIGAMATVLHGKVDAIVLTGGLAESKLLTGWIQESVEYIAPVLIFGNEDEMAALATGALRALNGEESIKEYL